MSKAVKRVKRSVKRVTKGAVRSLTNPFKAVKDLASDAWGEIRGDLRKLQPKVDIPDAPDLPNPAPPAPDAEQYVRGMSSPENTGRRRKRGGRSGLRIDLNTGGGGGGQGVNVPVG